MQASPTNSDAELDLVRLLYAAKGPDAARQELVARINAGGEVFPYQIALAEFDFSQGNFADSGTTLENLASQASFNRASSHSADQACGNGPQREKIDAAEALVSEVLTQGQP